MTVRDRGVGVKFGPKKCDIFLNGPLEVVWQSDQDSKLYCVVTEAHRWEQLARVARLPPVRIETTT